MTDDPWNIQTYVIPASHIRGYERGVRNETTDHLSLAVKKYVPKERKPESEHPITIIAAHGVGRAKELFEPFYKYLLLHSSLSVRAIWAFDAAHLGESYILNENIIGDEHHWLDTSRDLLQVVNFFQTEMIPPIFGFGESFGCTTTTMASIMNPRLFAGVVSVEPAFLAGNRFKTWLRKEEAQALQHRGVGFLKRRESWSSYEEARKWLLRAPEYKRVDPEVFELAMKWDLRTVPSSDNVERVQFKVPNSIAVTTMMAPDPPFPGHPPGPEYEEGNNTISIPGFYRGEVEQVQRSLPFVLPPVLYVWGNASDIGMSDYAVEQVSRTGNGRGGSGGVKRGQVTSHYIKGGGHSLVLEKPRDCALVASKWFIERLDTWQTNKVSEASEPPFDPRKLHKLYMERISKL